MDVLEALLLREMRREAQTAYQAQLLWQLNAQLLTLLGGSADQLPDWFALFPEKRAQTSAEAVRQAVLRGLADEKEVR